MINNIALRLVELRNKLGMSRTSFAKSIGISETHMKRFETGVAVPKEKLINTICEKYHVVTPTKKCPNMNIVDCR